MKPTQKNRTTRDRILRWIGWLLAALALVIAGDVLLALIKTGRYVFDVLVASLLYPFGLLLAARKWTPLFRILRLFFGVLAVYALAAVTLGLLGYQDLVASFYLWPVTAPIHLLPGGLQTFAVLAAGWLNQRNKQNPAPEN